MKLQKTCIILQMKKEKRGYKIYGNEKELLTYFPYRDDNNLNKDSYPIHIESVGITKPDPNYHVTRDNWNIFTIEYVISGSGYLEYNGKNYKLRDGDMYILSPDSTQRYGADKTNPYEKIWVNFRSNSFKEILKTFNFKDKIVFHFRGAYDYLKQIYDLKDSNKFVEDSSFISYKLIFDLLISIIQNEKIKQNKTPQYLLNAISYIDKQTPNPISIKELTEVSHVSQVTLINSFKKYVGETPYAYQLKTRLQLTKRYLTNSNKTLDEIAEICNFCDSFALSKSFKKLYGVSPKEYRILSRK